MFKQIYLDMDGVIVDWDAGVLREFGLPADAWTPTEWAVPYERVFGCSREVFWFRLDRTDFWQNLPKQEDCWRILSIVEPFRPVVLSACAVPAAYIGKLLWLDEHYPNITEENRFIFCRTEAKKYVAGPGKILIDDHEKNCEEWVANGGEAILYPRPWNSYRSIKYPLEYLMSEIMRLMGGK